MQQPTIQTQSAGSNMSSMMMGNTDMLKTTSPMVGMMSSVPMMAGNQGGGTLMMAANQGGTPMMASNQVGTPMMAGNQGGTGMMGGLSTMGGGNPSMSGQSMMMTGTPMMAGAGMMGGAPNMMGGVTMTPTPVMGNMMSSQQGMMSSSSANMPKSSSMGSNPTKNTQQVGKKSRRCSVRVFYFDRFNFVPLLLHNKLFLICLLMLRTSLVVSPVIITSLDQPMLGLINTAQFCDKK